MLAKLKEIKIFKDFKSERIIQIWQGIKEERVLVISISGILLVMYILLRIAVFPQIEKAASYRRELAITNESFYDLQKAIVEHPNIDEEIRLLTMRKEEIIANFPQERDFLAIAQKVLSEFEKRKVKVVNFKYIYDLKEDLSGGFKKYGLKLEVVSKYTNFVQILEDLEKEGIIFIVADIDMKKIAEGPLDIKIQLDFILKRGA